MGAHLLPTDRIQLKLCEVLILVRHTNGSVISFSVNSVVAAKRVADMALGLLAPEILDGIEVPVIRIVALSFTAEGSKSV